MQERRSKYPILLAAAKFQSIGFARTMAQSPDLEPWPAGKAPAAALCGEEARAIIMGQYGLDSLHDDPELRQIVRFAAQLCEAPVALVSLVEKERQRFIAREGLEERETPRPVSFCAYTMMQAEPMEVPDVRDDSRFSDNPLVTGHPHIRFYAGAPLISGEGAPLGSLCVIDTKPRPEGLTDVQREGLIVLAAGVMRRLRHRRETLTAAAKIERREKQLRTLIDSLPHIAFSLDREGKFDYLNARFDELTGAERPLKPEDWRSIIHEEDREELFAEWSKALEKDDPFDRQFRLLVVDGSWRWVELRVLPTKDEDSGRSHWFGTITDNEESHRHLQSREMLASELSHRIKNIFAVVTGLIALRARKYPEVQDFADELNATIRTLGRAHDFVRPVEGTKGDSLTELIKELMAPYVEKDSGRLVIEGADCRIGTRAATPLALIFHELATNAAKYGALSNEEGSVHVSMDCGETTEVVWRERGAPKPEQGAEGFGSRLVQMAVSGQLGGELERNWHEDGLEVILRLPSAMIAG